MAGSDQAVAAALRTLTQACSRIGLTLSTDKCELIPAARPHSQIDASLFPNDMVLKSDQCFELLGGAIGSAAYCNAHTSERVEKACKLLKAIGELPDPQVALLLLRYCASFGKLLYSARVVPHRTHAEALQGYDAAVRQCLEDFSCLRLG